MARTKISAHFIDARPAEGESTGIEGWLMYYDEVEKSWKPLRGELHIYIDGQHFGIAETDGYGAFSFHFRAPSIGRHRLEICFRGKRGFESSYKVMDFHVVDVAEKKRFVGFARNVAIALLILILLMLLLIFVAKLF